ncbi:MAG: hypothetical protein LC749_16285, partial [Actinobacteria bacterium]|nr:hypothetical protein [Actinomycetota bacterium]
PWRPPHYDHRRGAARRVLAHTAAIEGRLENPMTSAALRIRRAVVLGWGQVTLRVPPDSFTSDRRSLPSR